MRQQGESESGRSEGGRWRKEAEGEKKGGWEGGRTSQSQALMQAV